MKTIKQFNKSQFNQLDSISRLEEDKAKENQLKTFMDNANINVEEFIFTMFSHIDWAAASISEAERKPVYAARVFNRLIEHLSDILTKDFSKPFLDIAEKDKDNRTLLQNLVSFMDNCAKEAQSSQKKRSPLVDKMFSLIKQIENYILVSSGSALDYAKYRNEEHLLIPAATVKAAIAPIQKEGGRHCQQVDDLLTAFDNYLATVAAAELKQQENVKEQIAKREDYQTKLPNFESANEKSKLIDYTRRKQGLDGEVYTAYGSYNISARA